MCFRRDRFSLLVSQRPVTLTKARRFRRIIYRASTRVRRFPFSNYLMVNSNNFRRITNAVRLILIRIIPAFILSNRYMRYVSVSIQLLNYHSLISPFIHFLFRFKIQIISRTMNSAFRHFVCIQVIRRSAKVLPYPSNYVFGVLRSSNLILCLISASERYDQYILNRA